MTWLIVTARRPPDWRALPEYARAADSWRRLIGRATSTGLNAVLAPADLRCPDGQIDLEDRDGLPDVRVSPVSVCPACAGSARQEKQCRNIRSLVGSQDGNIRKAARHLGVSRTTGCKHLAQGAAAV